MPRTGKNAANPESRDAEGSHGVSADELGEELKRAGFALVAVEAGDRRGVLIVAKKP